MNELKEFSAAGNAADDYILRDLINKGIITEREALELGGHEVDFAPKGAFVEGQWLDEEKIESLLNQGIINKKQAKNLLRQIDQIIEEEKEKEDI